MYRHSFKAQYLIINLNSGSRYDLTTSNQSVQLAVWGPVGNAIAYVYENNIYYKSTATSEDPITITSTANFVTNGVPDWVYEGTKLCFY